MAVQLLNIDSLIEIKRAIVIKGVEYSVVEQSVDQMLQAIRVSREMEQKEKSGESADDNSENVLREMVEAVQNAVPDCPRAVLGTLPLSALNAILEFSTKSFSEAAEAAVEQEKKGETPAS